MYPVNSTPIIDDGILYGSISRANFAVKVATGERLWETTQPTTGDKPASSGTAFLVKNADRYFIFNERGELIIAKLTPGKYEEISRESAGSHAAGLWPKDRLEPSGLCQQVHVRRNDKEIVCVSLAE